MNPPVSLHSSEFANLGDSASATRAFREALLQPTLLNALRTEFYRDVWQGIDTGGVSLDALNTLPIVNKELLRKAGRRAQVRGGLVCDEVFTTGTTAEPFVSVKGNREQEYIHQFFTTLFKDVRPAKVLRGLQINNPFHGHHISVPAPIHFHKIGIYDKGSLDHGLRTLIASHLDEGVEPHCMVLTGLERCLRAFAHKALEEFPEGVKGHLSYVVPYAQYLTNNARELFRRAFNCAVVDRFGMSEIFGGASQSPDCGWYHFDPFVIPEVVTPRGRVSISEGRGILLLTALYPFQEAQPMVRYDTGDIVEVTRTRSSRPGSLAIKPLGRARYGVPLAEEDDWLLTPAEVYEAIDVLPEIQRSPLFRDSAQVKDPFVIGHPKFNSSYADEGRIRCVTINIAVAQSVADHQHDGIKGRLLDSIIENSAVLRQKIQAGEGTLDVCISSDFDVHFISYAD